jgi:cytochrome c1
VWDSVAFIWRSNTNAARLAQGAQLYAQNCAACHGETGQGDGVMAAVLKTPASSSMSHGEHELTGPSDFTDSQSARRYLGRAAWKDGACVPACIISGIFTMIRWSLVDYLWTFQFD